ncbi:MAG TPA: DinB family protein [Halothiobacillaceae bacterium]|nr:DinB family protein [Halothiobacillaceae bacterium]
MAIDLEFFITRFSANAEAIERLLKDIDEPCAKWKPAEDKWSILEVVCHLVDEERLDFRMRLDHLLHKPDVEWPPVDPHAWVVEHGYSGKDVREQLLLFLAERYQSIEWLGSLQSPDWNTFRTHAKLGDITAGSMLGSWLAHDYLHLRQLSNLYLGYLKQQVHPHSLNYADPRL